MRTILLLSALSIFPLVGCVETAPPPTVETSVQSLPEHIAARLAGYPRTSKIYCDDALMQEATLTNSKVVIYLPLQRGRFYVRGQIAADFPVSTGKAGHDTPTGVFRILHKEECHQDYRGATYQEYPLETNTVEVKDEYGIVRERKEVATTTVSRLEPYEWPWAMCLTWDGVYMYAHEVTNPGVRESGGCVRVPPSIQKKLFSVMKKDFVVYVCRTIPQKGDMGRVEPKDVKYIPPQR